MVAALILFLLLIVFLAFFVGKNLTNMCTIWFFKEFTQVSVATLVFITFACGILCALLLLLFIKVKQNKKKAVEEAVLETAEKNKDDSKKSKSLKGIFSKNSKKNTEKSDSTVTTDSKSDETIIEQSISKE